jgi:PAS domain S-box-containing protein
VIDSDASHHLSALLEAMLASSLDAVVTVDADGRVLTFNPAAEAIFGYQADDALGRDVAELIIPPALRKRHYAALSNHLSTGARTILNRRVELTGIRADGSEFPVELTVTRVPVGGPPTFTAYLRDITEQKAAERDLRDSRLRVVESADRERKRIERNLHDGAQQRLVSIGIILHRLAMEADIPHTLIPLIELAQDEAGLAIAELRELARGIHPASLTETGLPGALRGLALRCPAEVTVEIDDVRLPESVEIALYFVAAEALANVAKYAQAERVGLQLRVQDGTATLRIADDGVGGADQGRGSGLEGLVDRLEAVGGMLQVESPDGAGTAITAVAPVH